MEAQYGLAATAGLVAALNPCGFALLPAYLSFLVGDGSDDRVGAIRRAVTFTSAVTVGFVTVFGGFGLLAAPAADTVARNAPWVGIAVGVLMVVVGGWLVTGRSVSLLIPRVGRSAPVTRGFFSMALFGAGYALASLGCTIGPFLALVATSFRAGSAGAGVGLFVAYAGGMALLVGAAAGVVAVADAALVRRMRRYAGTASRLGGALAMIAGGYVAWYGWYELRVLAGGDPGDPVVDVAGRVQAALAAGVAALGPWWLTLAVGGAVAIVLAARLVRRRRRRPLLDSPPAGASEETAVTRERRPGR
jgi:cytochrome c biogenesis protein CcdA